MSDIPLFKIAIGCFFALFFMIGVGMGITAYNSGAPLLFAIVPIGMGVVALIFGIGILKGGTPSSMPSPPSFQIPSRSDMDHFVGERTISSGEKIVYQVPAKCPECGANLGEENIEWVGPLQAQCPYCSATIDAEERVL